MGWLSYNTLIVLAGTSLLGAVSGLVGSFAVLRRRALTGDALAHAALPGLCLAFLVVQERSLPWLLTGAFASGVVGVVLISVLRRSTRIKEDAAIGIVLSVFYGGGIVLLSIIQQQTTNGSKAGLKSYILGATAGMIRSDVFLIGAVCIVCIVLVLAMFKEFKLVSFDPGFAEVQGWPVLAIDLGLMTMVALTVVIGLPAVGAVMMAALLIIPSAAARFWTNRLSLMLLLSAIFGTLTGALGTLATTYFANLPAGPTIVLVGSFIFVCSMLFAPARGIVASWRRMEEFRSSVLQQRVLVELAHNPDQTFEKLLLRRSWSGYKLQSCLDDLVDEARVRRDGLRYCLTPDGESAAKRAERGMALWKIFLVEHPQLTANFSDLDVERIDEVLPREVIESLEAKLAAEAGGAA